MLRTRFKTSKFTCIAIVLKKIYTMNDAARRRKSRKYAQTVIRTVKTTELNDTIDHLLIVSNVLNVDFQRDIDEPNKITTLNVFVFDKRKHQWWAQVLKMKQQQLHPQTGRQNKLKQFPPMNRQYQPQPNFQRQLFQFQPYQTY